MLPYSSGFIPTCFKIWLSFTVRSVAALSVLGSVSLFPSGGGGEVSVSFISPGGGGGISYDTLLAGGGGGSTWE